MSLFVSTDISRPCLLLLWEEETQEKQEAKAEIVFLDRKYPLHQSPSDSPCVRTYLTHTDIRVGHEFHISFFFFFLLPNDSLFPSSSFFETHVAWRKRAVWSDLVREREGCLFTCKNRLPVCKKWCFLMTLSQEGLCNQCQTRKEKRDGTTRCWCTPHFVSWNPHNVHHNWSPHLYFFLLRRCIFPSHFHVQEYRRRVFPWWTVEHSFLSVAGIDSGQVGDGREKWSAAQTHQG